LAAPTEVRLKPADRIVSKWAERAKAGVNLYAEFTAQPKRDPTAAAVSMKATWQAKVSSTDTANKWEQALRNVGFQGYLYGVKTKGVNRFPQGVDAGTVYMQQFMSQFLPHVAAGLSQVYRLPKTNIEESINRAATMIRHNAKFRFQKRGATPPAT
jgi:hypothetical protein